jgi:hypothetical protein
MKKKVYIETTIVSYLTGRPSGDLLIAARQLQTRQWWDEESKNYELMVSNAVLEEISEGNVDQAVKRMGLIEGVAVIVISDDVKDVAEALIQNCSIPASSYYDALHVAICAVYDIDLLLTWNCKHLANPFMLPKIYGVLQSLGYLSPLIVTPEQLLEVSNAE